MDRCGRGSKSPSRTVKAQEKEEEDNDNTPPGVGRKTAAQSTVSEIKRNVNLPIRNDVVYTIPLKGLNPDTTHRKKPRSNSINGSNGKGYG